MNKFNFVCEKKATSGDICREYRSEFYSVRQYVYADGWQGISVYPNDCFNKFLPEILVDYAEGKPYDVRVSTVNYGALFPAEMGEMIEALVIAKAQAEAILEQFVKGGNNNG